MIQEFRARFKKKLKTKYQKINIQIQSKKALKKVSENLH